MESEKLRKVVISPKHYNVTLKGIQPLLMDRMPKENFGQPKAQAKKQTQTVRLEDEWANWRTKLYFREDIGVYIPGENFRESMKSAAAYWGEKVTGNKTYTNLVTCAVVCEDFPIGIMDKNDTENIIPFGTTCNGTPTKPKGAVVFKVRPMIPAWEAKGMIHVFDNRLTENVLVTILAYAGAFTSVGNWRQNYGKFELTGFEEVNGSGKPKT